MATPRSLEAARHQPRPSTHACASGSRVRQSRGHHFCWNEPSVFALKIRRPARAFDLHAHPGTRPVLGSQCPSPEPLVRSTTERAETHISGPDVRAVPASAHGPGVSQCPCPEGTWTVACLPQLLTRDPSRPPTSCFCLCEAGSITSVPAGGVFPPVHPATGLCCF
jgi:hypothetical protein